MIIGTGMIASSFEPYKDNDDVLIFASGVSNSSNSNYDNYKREELLLKDSISNNIGKIIVYFSTCSIYDKFVNKSSYVQHKLRMELIIKKMCDRFYIFRLPQVVGVTNSPTLINYLFTSVLKEKEIDVYSGSTRNLIGVRDVFFIIDYIIRKNKYLNEATNIATPYNMRVLNLVLIVEEITNTSVRHNILEHGYASDINIDKIVKLGVRFKIFSLNYTKDLLRNFYQQVIEKKV